MTALRLELGLDIGLTRLTAAVREGREEPRPLHLAPGRLQIDIASFPATQGDQGGIADATARVDGASWRDSLAQAGKGASPGSTPPRWAIDVLKQAAQKSHEQINVSVAATALIVPTDWGVRALRDFQDAVALAELGETRLVAKAEAVATAFTRLEGVMDGDLLAVVDVGGSTFEASVLRAEGSRLALAGAVVSRRGIAGNAVDNAIAEHAVNSLKIPALPGWLNSSDPTWLAARRQLLLDCRTAKEALTTKQSVPLTIALPGKTAGFTLTSSDVRSLCAPIVESVLQAIREALTSAQVATSRVRAILLTGGSARLAPLRQAVTQAFDARLLVSSMPEADAALGATLVGGLGVADTLPRSSLSSLAATRPTSRGERQPAAPQAQQEPAPESSPPDQVNTAANPSETPPVAPGIDRPNVEDTRVVPNRPILGGSESPVSPDGVTADGASSRSRWRTMVLAVACLLVIAGVAFFAFTHLRSASGPGAARTPNSGPTLTGPTTSTTNSTSPPPHPTAPVFPVASNMIVMSLSRGRTATIVAQSTTGPAHKVLVHKETKGSPQPRSPNIAPNRKSLVYLMARKNGQPGVPWVADADPAQPSRVSVHRLFSPGGGSPCATTTRPSFSPDSSRLAVMCVGAPGHASGLYVVDAHDGTHARIIYPASSKAPRLDLHSNPTWTGTDAIAFQARTGSGPDEIWSIDLSAPASHRPVLQSGAIPGWNSHTDWSRTGGLLLLNQHTVVHAGHHVAQSVVLLRRHGSSKFITLSQTIGAKAPCWAPSGNAIAFLRDRHLVTMRLNGTGVHVVKIGIPGNPLEPAWDSK